MNDTVNKSDLTKVVADITGLKIKDVDQVISEFINQAGDYIYAGRRTQIHGLGTFETHPVKARKGRNPSTGEIIDIPAGKRIRFRPSSALKGK